MIFHLIKATNRLPQIFFSATVTLSLVTMTSETSANPKETWTCEETAYYSIYEDTSLTEGKKASRTKTLTWLNDNAVALESISLSRTDSDATTFVSKSSGSSLFINQTEKPHMVVLMQPQVWMNKFGNMRVRFYRCQP